MNALDHRSPTLVLAILGAISDDPEPVPWNGLVAHFTTETKYSAKTVENVLYDLCTFGAIVRLGRPREGRRPDTRALRTTVLGQAWLEQRLEPLPTIGDDPPAVNN